MSVRARRSGLEALRGWLQRLTAQRCTNGLDLRGRQTGQIGEAAEPNLR
jgi:hypothetical protein